MAPRVSVLGVLLALACGGESRPIVLDVRTDLPENLRDYVEENFEALHADIDVRFSVGGAQEGLDRLRAEIVDGSAPDAPFDVWWGADVMTLSVAASAGLLAPYRPSWASGDGRAAVGRDDSWYPLSITPWVIAFDRDDLQLSRAPTDWNDLRHFRWADEIEMLDPQRTEPGALFVASMLAYHERQSEVQAGFDWLSALDGQVETYAGSIPEALQALRSGGSRLAILPRSDVEAERASEAPSLHYRIPESGTPVLARGVALISGTRERESAEAFVEYLGSREVGTATKLETRWQPAFGGVDSTRIPDDFELMDPWTPHEPALDRIQSEGAGWIERWDREVRGR